jgi:hypothetical protein
MAKQFHLRRRAALAASLFLLGTVGCAFPHGNTAGDPILGNFNRPIVPTPPPERGGLGLDSPAYDAGARIGMTPPDVAAPFENTSGFMSLPPLTSPNLLSDVRTPFGSPAEGLSRRPVTASGAKLPMSSEQSMRSSPFPTYRPPTGDGAGIRPRDPHLSFTSATSFAPSEPPSPIRQVDFEVKRDPSRLETVQDGQSMLQEMGARSQRMEQLDSGEWNYSCAMGLKVYEARGKDQMEALKNVIEQVKARQSSPRSN